MSAKTNRNYIEDSEQEALIKWAGYEKIYLPASPMHNEFISDCLFAIPNGGKRHLLEAVRLKKQGVVAGIPDLFFHVPRTPYSGLFVEMKRPCTKFATEGTIKPAQRKKIDQLIRCGYQVCVCYGWVDAKEAIQNYLTAS